MDDWRPDKYDAWYQTPLGKLADSLEKELVFSLAEVRAGEKALDDGCGTGIYSLELAKRGAMTSGVDASEKMLARARAKADRERLAIDLLPGDALSLPFPDGSFDVVLSEGMLCFVREREKALREMHRILKPGGRVVIGVLNRWSHWAGLRRVKGLFKNTVYRKVDFLAPAEMEHSLKMAGFEAVEARTCIFFPPIDNPLFLRFANIFERLGKRLVPRTGAFLALRGVKRAG